MSMRSGGDEARSRSRSRRDTAVLVERERERDSRRRFRLLSRDLERFRTRSLSRDRDRDRLRFLLCLLLLVCLERDELRLRDRPILPGDAVTNRWPRAPHVPGYPRLRLRMRADRPVEARGKKAVSRLTFYRSLRPKTATKAASNDKAATPGVAKMAAAAAPAAPPTMPRAERAVARAPPPTLIAEGEASASERSRLLPPAPPQPDAREPEPFASAFELSSPLLSGCLVFLL
nr:uncharacterized protein LOC116283154 [Vicugna pacos]